MNDNCAICDVKLNNIDGDLCGVCSSKYGIDDDTITIGKIRKKKKEE
jgi:hypothetical protein